MSKKNIILSVVLGLILCVTSYLSLNQIVGMWSASGIGFLLFFVFCILVGINVKKENGGFASFGTLVKSFAIMIGISVLISMTFGVVNLTMMDETTKDSIIDKMVDGQIEFYEKMGLDDDMMDEMEEKLEEGMVSALNPMTFVLNGFMGILFYLLLSLIPAAIMKKNPPTEFI